MLKRIFFALILFSFSFAFADVKITNPVEGVWSNQQVLLIEADHGESVVYTLSGDDPFTSGLAYDGPVPIDLQGDITITAGITDAQGKKTIQVVKCTVLPPDCSALDQNQGEFIKKITENPFYDLNCGTILAVPDGISYTFSDNLEEFNVTGKDLFVSELQNIERYTPVSVKTDDGRAYRFILHSVPVNQGEYTRREVPFTITEWENLEFTDPKKIYSVDGSWWQSSKAVFTIDRSLSHTIMWQSVDYSPDNPVESVIIPPGPVLKTTINEDRSVTISLEGNSDFRIAECSGAEKNTSSAVAKGLHKTLVFDAYDGERYSENFSFDVYCDNIYQGTLFSNVNVSRQKPQPPQFIMDSGTYSRKDVTLTVDVQENCQLYTYVYPELKLSVEDIIQNNVEELKARIINGRTAEYNLSDNSPINCFTRDSEEAYAFVVTAYVVDKWQNISDSVELFFIIDKVNYFVGEVLENTVSDGTVKNPYRSLKELEGVINSNKFTRAVFLSPGQDVDRSIILKSNAEFLGTNSSLIRFTKNACLSVENAGLKLNNIILEKKTQDYKTSTFLCGSTSTVELDNSQVVFNGSKNATAVTLSNTIFKMSNSDIVVNSSDYGCCISQRNSSVDINGSRLSAVCQTAVNLSSKNGHVNMTESKCSINGTFGRIAEFFATKGQINYCDFTASGLVKNYNTKPLWIDERSTVVEKANKSAGF